MTTHMLNKFIKTARGDDAKWEKTALACENAFCFRSNTSLRTAAIYGHVVA